MNGISALKNSDLEVIASTSFFLSRRHFMDWNGKGVLWLNANDYTNGKIEYTGAT
jgi:hypothetical protein